MKTYEKRLVFSFIILMMTGFALLRFRAINKEEPEQILSETLHTSESISWAVNGTVICNATNSQGGVRIVSDGTGGAIIAWYDNRPGSISTDI